MRSLIIRFFILSGLIFPALAPQAMAATINVTASATDTLNGANGLCSLREAITNINNGATTYADCAPTGAYGTSDTINIPAGTYTIALAGMNEDLNASGDFDILKSVAIVGAGAGAGTTTINGNRMDGVFDIRSGTVIISGVTITGGYKLGDGGGINSVGWLAVANSTVSGNTSNSRGGGIYSSAPLVVESSTISGNTVSIWGGGISSSGPVDITNSTISGNTVTGSGGGGGGGGILVYASAASTIKNSTISGNTATKNGGGIYGGNLTITQSTISGNRQTVSSQDSGGGGIYAISPVTVTDSTISNNSAVQASYQQGGGGIFTYFITTVVNNSTITGNTGCGIFGNSGGFDINSSTISGNDADFCHNFAGIGVSSGWLKATNSIIGRCNDSYYTSSNGFNLTSDTSCGFTGTGDKQNTDPLLGALANNGGPTQTMALLPGSPAIDAGLCQYGVDQRGAMRPQGAGCDIGAFEVGTIKANQTITFVAAPTVVVGGTGTVSATATSGLSVTLSSATASTCTISGSTVTGVSTGTCIIAADQAGDASFNAAAQVTQSITIGTASQTPISNTRMFVFAEANFPSIFSGAATAGQYLQYDYRFYPASGNYLAVDTSGMIYVLGTYTGNEIVPVGSMESFRSYITAWEATLPTCTSNQVLTNGVCISLPASYVSQGGLTWMPVTFYMTWADANSYCTGTTINGQTGWRLPTKDELSALYASGAMNGQGWTLGYT